MIKSRAGTTSFGSIHDPILDGVVQGLIHLYPIPDPAEVLPPVTDELTLAFPMLFRQARSPVHG